FFLMIRRPPRSTLFPYTSSSDLGLPARASGDRTDRLAGGAGLLAAVERGTAPPETMAARHGTVSAGGVGPAAHRGRGAGGFAAEVRRGHLRTPVTDPTPMASFAC